MQRKSAGKKDAVFYIDRKREQDTASGMETYSDASLSPLLINTMNTLIRAAGSCLYL